MAANTLPDNITPEDFQAALHRYDQIIQTISASKSTKPGQKTLAELDSYRYGAAPTQFSLKKSSRPMKLQDVKTLVEWKLKHGKFRPTLMKLVSSNDDSFTEDVIQDAVDLYKKSSDAAAAVNALVKLRGIGPATASLLLAVHDPEKVIFFADEAFYWLCSDGRRDSIKYNAKEYKDLNAKSQTLAKRLNVGAIDIERVAYVLMNGTDSSLQTDSPFVPKKEMVEAKKKRMPAKRNSSSALDEAPAPRRSKRAKRA